MKKSAILTTPAELREIADELELELKNPASTDILMTIIENDEDHNAWRFER